MFEKESGLGAANLQAEGLDGIYNIAKTFAELAAQMAQRDIRVEDLIIQTDKGTLSPDMDLEDARQLEADIRDVFMNPENKKNFRVFMEDPDGNRTLIFESKEGKIAPDLYDFRRNMMQFYAKADAESFGQNADEYFDEVVIKTGTQIEQPSLEASDAPIIDTDAVTEPMDDETPQEVDTTTVSAEKTAVSETPLPVDEILHPQQSQSERNERWMMDAITSNAATQNAVTASNLATVETLSAEYQTVDIPSVEDFLTEVREVSAEISQLQDTAEGISAGSLAVATQGSGPIEGWTEAVQATIAPEIPSLSDRLSDLSTQLVEYIRERAINDIAMLTEMAANAVNGVTQAISDVVDNAISEVQSILMGGAEQINQSIDSIVDNFGEDGVFEGDNYIIDASEHSVTRKSDGETIYAGGRLSATATAEDRRAINGIPSIAAESRTETQSQGVTRSR